MYLMYLFIFTEGVVVFTFIIALRFRAKWSVQVAVFISSIHKEKILIGWQVKH